MARVVVDVDTGKPALYRSRRALLQALAAGAVGPFCAGLLTLAAVLWIGREVDALTVAEVQARRAGIDADPCDALPALLAGVVAAATVEGIAIRVHAGSAARGQPLDTARPNDGVATGGKGEAEHDQHLDAAPPHGVASPPPVWSSPEFSDGGASLPLGPSSGRLGSSTCPGGRMTPPGPRSGANSRPRRGTAWPLRKD